MRPTRFLYRLFHDVMPRSRAQVARWTALAESIPDDVLRLQALSSLRHKRFHADGGAVYAAARAEHAEVLVELIVALQTISDYLDNLCDRCDVYNAADFRLLHDSMRAAVNPGVPSKSYYALRGSLDDGGYLEALVTTCQNCVQKLPSYKLVQAKVNWFVERYCELQEKKHIEPELREATLLKWSSPYADKLDDILWWEFSAATGSTLGMFSLFLAATEPLNEETVKELTQAYFPWVCGLHILLDYLIDLEEDAAAKDFNFVACYANARFAKSRIHHFAKESVKRARHIGMDGYIHRFVVKGLLAMYFSDNKVRRQRDVRHARRMLVRFGPTTWLFYWATLLYRIVR